MKRALPSAQRCIVAGVVIRRRLGLPLPLRQAELWRTGGFSRRLIMAEIRLRL